MKACVTFVGLLAIAVARSNLIPSSSVDETHIRAMIRGKGYPVETYKVTTSDGYILDLYRIPYGRNNSLQQQQQEQQIQDELDVRKNHQRQLKVGTQRPAILLMHGFMSSPEDFVVGDLALSLADKGYDVYLGSARGSRYGLSHTYLIPDKDPAFWLYCWDEIGTRDLPAIIDKVLEISEQQKLKYLGHMEGTTAFFVMGSELPEYQQKIDRMISLGPIAYMEHSNNEILKTIAKNMNRHWLMANVGVNKVKLSDNLLDVAKKNCKNNIPQICDNEYFLVKGYNSTNLEQTIINEIIDRVPFGGSARELIHLAQIISTGRFQRYDPSLENLVTKQHDLKKINVPIAVLYTKNDSLSPVDDVERLIYELPNVYYSRLLLDFGNNFEFLYGDCIGGLFKLTVDSLEADVYKKSFV